MSNLGMRWRSRLVLLLIALLIVALDQATKSWVLSQLAPYQSLTLAPWLAPIFSVTYVTNTGGVFGLFPGSGNAFLVIAIVVIITIAVYIRALPDSQLLVHAVLGVMLGGALGNVVDRLRVGHVVDWFDLNFWPLEAWPVFNVADASIVFGVVALALLSLREERLHAEQVRAERQAAGEQAGEQAGDAANGEPPAPIAEFDNPGERGPARGGLAGGGPAAGGPAAGGERSASADEPA